jgi:hypothetical protein
MQIHKKIQNIQQNYYKCFAYNIQVLQKIHHIHWTISMWVTSEHFKFLNKIKGFKVSLSILKTCEFKWLNFVYSDISIIHTFLKVWHIGSWSRREYLSLVLTLVTAKFVWNCSWLFTAMFINEDMYLHARGKILTS